MAKLETVDISFFRGIMDLSIKPLGHINLVVGDNNSGKTSVLEAIELLRSPELGNLYRIARQRETLSGLNTNSIYENFLCMFSRGGDKLEFGISSSIAGKPLSCCVTGKESRVLLDSNDIDRNTRRKIEESGDSLETDAFDGVLEYREGESVLKTKIHMDRYSKITGTVVSSFDRLRIVYVSPFEHLRGSTVSYIVRNEGYKEICIKALQLFDPNIDDILILRSDTGDRPVEYLKHRKLGIMPLSTYGDGIKKVLVLSNAIASADGGILLIDEIETAIHRKYYDDIFRFIVKAAKTFNVQVFITTHSIEAIDGILATEDYDKQNDFDDVIVATLKRNSDHTFSRVMSGREVFRNREDFGFEVRL